MIGVLLLMKGNNMKHIKKFDKSGYRIKKPGEEFVCDVCGIGEKAYDKIHPWNNFAYLRDPLASFRLSIDGSVLCGACNKEKQLESLFKLLDARDEKMKKENNKNGKS